MTNSECISNHRVMIFDRGGKQRVVSLQDVASVNWSREMDKTSLGKATLSAKSCDRQMENLLKIAAKRHEMVIFRGSQRVWEGPVEEVNWLDDGVSIVSKDVSNYPFDAPLSKPWPNSSAGGPVYMTQRVEEILIHELTQPYTMLTGAAGTPVVVPRWENLTPPANVLPYLDIRHSTGPQGILTRSETLAFEMTVGEHLGNLAEGGLNFTTVGRRLVVWDSAVPLGKTRILTESDFFGKLRVISAGSEHASIGHISAQREEGAPDPYRGVGNAGAADDFYGVWTRLVSLTSEEGSTTPNQVELNSQARRTIAGRNPVPMEIITPKGGIRLSFDLTINELVPGTVMPVRAQLNLYPVQQDQLLTRVTVNETSSGETVSIELTPIGGLVLL